MNKMSARQLSYVLLRFALGANIFLHGQGRLGPMYAGFVEQTVNTFKEAILPEFVVEIFAYALPPAELVVGLLLIVGLCTRTALVAGQLLMIALMTGMCLLQKWDVVGLQMIYILTYALLLFGLEYDGLSVDRWWAKRRALKGK